MKKTLLILVFAFTFLSAQSQNHFETLINKINKGSSEEFKSYFEEINFDANFKNPDKGITLMYHAASKGNLEVCKFLFLKGANVNIWSKYGNPINWALEKQNIKIAELFLKKGFDVSLEAKQKSIEEPLNLQAAFLENDPDRSFYKKLIDFGMDLNLQGEKGISAIHISVMREDTNLIKLLADNGANLNSKIKMPESRSRDQIFNGLTPIELAVYMERNQSLLLLNKLLNLGVLPEQLKDKSPKEVALLFKLTNLLKRLEEMKQQNE